ncbi:lipid IV(A) 3-deoxy-D-manno-octulosonic acid transferase [Vibrio hangzhouensis]|uniref:lipid IV(A) 3-deoxy-D-manno-octulosonic acid transferase n=1 Tax=Vibrio hangzhouensis TaxID=462991 RepID=UPI001C988231|nr:lipid IV(A) 3-deoxy-D-manno-octulosonic acid transferase [Vibrio hangzhouensis]MBY6198442.1 lipid IV(A) 3-deoxy-D-manno-octulosonic acid transferase [Vibrio hangzhouensis]
MLRQIYTLLLIVVSPFFLYGLFKKKKGKPSIGERWKEHFGFTPALSNARSQPIWIHAVSVGEVIAISPLIKRLKKAHPDMVIVLTTTTPTGAEQASKLGGIIEHRYMPLDFGFAVKGFLEAIHPSQLLIVETELWPNTLHWVAKNGIPITILNARLSERSCQRYAKVQPVFDLLSNRIATILCQHQDDAERFIRLGVEPEKVSVTGSLKFDISVNEQDIEAGKKLRQQMADRPVWIASSTHEGEDEQLLAVHRKILELLPEALMILVPRHPERFQSVLDAIKKHGFTVTRRTENQPITPETEVFLGDTMGEMMTLLSASDVCFMGGSLLGNKVGGHNLLEPAALGIPMVTGPSYFNFKDITEQLHQLGACDIIPDTATASTVILALLNDPQHRVQIGETAKSFVQANKGAIERTLTALDL